MWSFAKRFEPYVAVFEQCAADAACNAAYPDLAARFGALLDKLEKTPLVLDPPLVVNPQLTFALPPVLKQIDADFFVQLADLNNLVFERRVRRGDPAPDPGRGAGRRRLLPRPPSLAATAPAPRSVQTVDPHEPATRRPRFQAAQPLFEAPFQTLLVLAQAAAAQAQTGIDSQWLSIVLGDLAARLAGRRGPGRPDGGAAAPERRAQHRHDGAAAHRLRERLPLPVRGRGGQRRRRADVAQ